MKRQRTGHYQSMTTTDSQMVRAFIPHPLPPEPHIRIDGPLLQSMEQALLCLGRLDNLARRLPSVNWLLYPFVRREALLSSQIEGTQTSFSDLLLFENRAASSDASLESAEVHNYVLALERGLKRVREDDMPLSNRLFLELHAILLAGGRGGFRSPGEFRRGAVWIGGDSPADASFVPPPHLEVAQCMADLERFLNTEDDGLPALVRIALAHVQFETIHPFYDGNGRLGRLLISLFLCRAGILQEPLLYLSLYLKRQRPVYYSLLQQMRQEGDWEQWLAFFFTGVRETAQDALTMADDLEDLFELDRERIERNGRRAGSALRVHETLRAQPFVSIAHIRRQTNLSQPGAANGLQLLIQMGIVEEVTGQRRNRLFAYRECMKILSRGAEPL